MATQMDRLWADYEAHHRTGGNKFCHVVGIPLIIAGLLGLLSVPLFHIGLLPVEPAFLLVVVTGPVYLWLDAGLGSVMVAFSVLLYLGARLLPWPVALGLFLAGWVFQFVGHAVYEKRSPAFLGNLAHLFVGPLWALNHLVALRSTPPTSPISIQKNLPGGTVS